LGLLLYSWFGLLICEVIEQIGLVARDIIEQANITGLLLCVGVAPWLWWAAGHDGQPVAQGNGANTRNEGLVARFGAFAL